METSTQIVQIFAHVAEHPDQCYDFDIQGNLDKYMSCGRDQSNFSQAAFLICDAARIYGRKVDYVEQTLLDFNRRSAANVANAIAEKQKELEEADQTTTTTTNNKDPNNKKSKQTEQEKREKEKEKALKRAKRMCKVTSKIEFKPKPFQIGTPEQISLNLYEERSELDLEDDYDQVRMKNVFPRINVLQSNLQSNNTFYDNLNIVEENCENLDALRDFRIFMDTIDEPIYMRPNKNRENDPQYKKECDRVQRRANQKHSNLYLSAEYVKENYGVTLKDNSDYLNMLKYNEEVERLNLRKLSIEQLAKLKVGTYLNNILHGNKQDEQIPEFDSGIVDDIGCSGDPEMDNANTSDTLYDDIDMPMTDVSAMNTTDEVDSCLESSVNMSIEPSDQSLNVTNEMENTIPSSAEQTAESLNASTEGDSTAQTSMEQSTVSNDVSTDGDTTLPSAESTLNSTSEQPSSLCEAPNANETNEMDRTARQSLDDGLGGSLPPLSPSRMSEFAGFDSNDIIEDIATPIKVPELEVNIFKLPENLLRRKRIFQLTEEFDLWVAARKRKIGLNPKDPPSCGKLLKLSNGAIIRTDVDSECDVNEFLGFDENNDICTANNAMIINEINPGAITNRTCSSDSGISPEKAQNSEDSNPDPKLPENGAETATDTAIETVNDSGVADMSSTSELNNSTESADQTGQETDISNVSDGNIAANSTKIFDETTSILTGLDSGFDELHSQITENNSTIEGESGESSKVNESNEMDEAIEADSDVIMAECVSPIMTAESDINKEVAHVQEEEENNDELTDMVGRVSKWHEMLRPVLANCEKRNNFDIHALGSDIMNLFPEENPNPSTEISFTDVMKDRDQTYTARYFLSLLLLTNNKNVDLKVRHPEQNGKIVCSKDDIRIKLQSRNRHLDEVNKMDKHLEESTIRVDEPGLNIAECTQAVRGGKKATQKRKWNKT